MSIDYTIFYKSSVDPGSAWSNEQTWDVFLSAYNSTDRVQRVFQEVRARDKYWIVHSEYHFSPQECPTCGIVFEGPPSVREDDFVELLLKQHLPDISSSSLCIDISGFMRPHLMFLVRALAYEGVRGFDALYSEPAQYAHREQTEFTQGSVADVRPVAGFEGLHQPSMKADEDLLIIGAGYEYRLIQHVANAKTNTKKLQMLGFPPLQADFYQENVLNAHRAAEAVSAINEAHPIFAPANDPFVTASVLQETIADQRRKGAKNIYLCPLSTRPQALGFALYYVYEAREEPISIIYPFATRYARAAATGLSRIWQYRVELP
jgi:hypothetical protein